MKCSSLLAWRVLLISASPVICPGKISEILERLPRSAREAGALACAPCHLMPRLRGDSASWSCKPQHTQPLSVRYLIGLLPCGLLPVFSPVAEIALPPPLAFS